MVNLLNTQTIWGVNPVLLAMKGQGIRFWSPRTENIKEIKYSQVIADIIHAFQKKSFKSEDLSKYIADHNLDYEADEVTHLLYQQGILISHEDYAANFAKLDLGSLDESILYFVLYRYTYRFYMAAKELGYSVKHIHPGLIEVSSKKRKHWILIQSFCSLIKKANQERVVNKEICSNFLLSKGFGAPKGFVDTIDKIEIGESDLSFPVVLKPLDGGGSDSVVCNIKSIDELKAVQSKILETSGNRSRRFRVEEHIEGETIRFFYACEEVKAATKIGFPFIEGDGETSIVNLINKKYDKWRGKIHVSIQKTLSGLGLELTSVLEKGKSLTLTKTAGPSLEGEKTNLDDVVPMEIKDLVKNMMKSLGLLFGCAEAVVPMKLDGTYDYKNMKFIDINAVPDFLLHGRIRDNFVVTIFPELITWIMESEAAEPIFPVELPIYTRGR